MNISLCKNYCPFHSRKYKKASSECSFRNIFTMWPTKMVRTCDVNAMKQVMIWALPPSTSSETYPYPKGEHNGAAGPKYAS